MIFQDEDQDLTTTDDADEDGGDDAMDDDMDDDLGDEAAEGDDEEAKVE